MLLFSLANANSPNLPPTYLTTPKGNIFTFRTNQGLFRLQWNQKGKWKHLEYKFQVRAAMADQPTFVAENDRYVLLKAGCGNSCRIGFFFRLEEGRDASVIDNYLAYDLDQDFVARISNDNKLQVLNLKTHKTVTIKNPQCESKFSRHCVDTIYFQKKQLKFKWKSKEGSANGQWYKFKISI